jgi:molybdopterin synthase sulfur carrier subunit
VDVNRSAIRVMVRIELPYHLRQLAHIEGDVMVEVTGAVTPRVVIDELESRFPMLRGTIRDHATGERRAYLRFFACEQDVSFAGMDAALPAAVASGREPFLIVGAISGG